MKYLSIERVGRLLRLEILTEEPTEEQLQEVEDGEREIIAVDYNAAREEVKLRRCVTETIAAEEEGEQDERETDWELLT